MRNNAHSGPDKWHSSVATFGQAGFEVGCGRWSVFGLQVGFGLGFGCKSGHRTASGGVVCLPKVDASGLSPFDRLTGIVNGKNEPPQIKLFRRVPDDGLASSSSKQQLQVTKQKLKR